MSSDQAAAIEITLSLLNKHYDAFVSIADTARQFGHPVPMDTRSWSQIIVSALTGINGLERKKGSDLADGSDVKGANTWEAIDTPRFNNVIKAGTQADHSDSMDYLDATPFLFFVLWDIDTSNQYRCRIWVVRPQIDSEFRTVCRRWYEARRNGSIRSTNFQLHPPRGKDTDDIRNTFGNLSYPLLFSSVRKKLDFELETYNEDVMTNGFCTRI